MSRLLELLLLLPLVLHIWSNNCALGHVASSSSSSSSEDYINFRLKQTKGESHAPAAGEGKWKNLWSRPSPSQQPRAVNLLDDTFIIEERRRRRRQVLLPVALNLDEANDTRQGLQLNLASPNQSIKFIKSYSRSEPSLSLLIVCQSSSCTHYRAVKGSSLLQDEQSIGYPALVPIDAAFFEHAAEPHLVIAYDSDGDHSAEGVHRPSSKIYQWNGTRMVCVDQLVVGGPTSVVAFQNALQSTLILFTVKRDADATGPHGSTRVVVYQLDDNDHLIRRLRSANMDALASIYPYNYAKQPFFLAINATGSAEVWRWNAADQFEALAKLPNIQPALAHQIVPIDKSTLLFVSLADALRVYEMQDKQARLLAELALVNGQRVIEITAWKYQEDAIMLLLIKMNAEGTFLTELWQMNLGVQDEQTDIIEESDEAAAWACLRLLKGALDSRAVAIEHFQIAQSLHVADVKINAASASLVEFRKQLNATVASPRRMKEQFIGLRQSLSALKDKMLKIGAILSGNVSVDSEPTRIEELHIDSLEASHINGKRADLENYLISGMDQQFSGALNAKKVSVDELSVSSLCGYGVDHWMQVNDSARSSIANLKNINGSSIVVLKDTIVIESDSIMKELNTRRINGIDWKDFLDNLFIIGGKEQTIKGAVRYEGIVQVLRLYSEQVNNVSSSDLITKPSNQSLRDVFIDTLQAEQLYVEKINGVPIDAAARTSRENVIKGKLTLAKLVITDELAAQESIAIPLTRPTQVYDRVRIDGHVFLRNLELEEHCAWPNLAGEEPVRASLRRLLVGSWTKSTEQLIEAPTSLRRGASIDRLDCLRLNGLAEGDFLYTDSAQLSDLENVTFAHFHSSRRVLGSSAPQGPASSSSLVEETKDHLIFRRALGLRRLAVDGLFADKYNGIPIGSIMQPAARLAHDLEVETVRVEAGMSVEELRANRLNSRSVAGALGAALRTDGPASLAGLVDGARLSAASLHASRLEGRDLSGALAGLEELLLLLSSGSAAVGQLTVEGGVAIEGGLQVDRINGEGASEYVGRMRGAAADGSLDIGSLVDLAVVDNLEVGLLLNGRTLDRDFFAGALSRSERQTLDGRVAFVDAQINYLTADAINGLDLSKLIYVDRPAVIRGNVSFSRLRLDAGHVTSRTFKGQSASKLEGRLRRLPTNRRVENLLVQADVKWDEPSSNSRSLAHLLDNAVTKHDDHQLVASPVAFEKPVLVESLHLSQGAGSEVCRKISEIISDAVIDSTSSSNPITLRGTKIFKQGLTAGDLQVDGDIDIEHVNGLDIRRVGSQVFQKDRAQLVTADVTFLHSVEIARLLTTETKIHGVGLQQLALVGQKMPKKLHFQDLRVDGKLSLHKLDGLDFDHFIKHRVTVDQDDEIFADVQLMHSVRVSNGTVVASVNQVLPENLVESNADGIPIMLHGKKIFRSKLTVEQNMETSLINDIHVDSIYDNAVLNGANADILGSLVFEGAVEIHGNTSVSGEINGLERPSENWPNRSVKSSGLSKATTLLKSSLDGIDEETRASATSAARVLYLEEERKLDWHFAGVQSVESAARVKNKTRLEIVTAQAPELCGLPIGSDCLCRRQYIVEVSPSGEYEIQEQMANNVSNSFYLPGGPYGLRIMSGSASSSQQCSRSPDDDEHSKIFWFKFDGHREMTRRTAALLIDGYISDARIFQVDDQLYLIIAVFYNKQTRAHATDSLLYQFDLTNGKPYLVQRIPTDGAKIINLFQIPKVGMHLLIGCVKGRAESLLLRFNPTTRQFQMIRTFATAGSKYLASVSSNEQALVILSNPDVRALQIFNYEDHSDTFVDCQILFFESRVTSLGVFYSGDVGQSDAFLVTTTRNGWLYIYEYMLYGKFQQKMSYWADDIQVLTPFRHMSENYLFAGFKFNSTVYKVIQQGY